MTKCLNEWRRNMGPVSPHPCRLDRHHLLSDRIGNLTPLLAACSHGPDQPNLLLSKLGLRVLLTSLVRTVQHLIGDVVLLGSPPEVTTPVIEPDAVVVCHH